jgi:hypothetical protein
VISKTKLTNIAIPKDCSSGSKSLSIETSETELSVCEKCDGVLRLLCQKYEKLPSLDRAFYLYKSEKKN